MPIKTLVKIAITLAGLGYVAAQIDWNQVVATAGNADGLSLCIAFVGYLVAVVLQAERWRMLSVAAGAAIPWRLAQRVNFSAAFFDLFVPGKLGSDAYRIMSIGKSADRHTQLGVMLALRLQGTLAAAVVFLIAGTMLAQEVWQYFGLFLGTVAVIMIAAALLWLGRCSHVPRWFENSRFAQLRDFAHRLASGLRLLSRDETALIRSSLVAIAFVLVATGVYIAAGHAFQMSFEFIRYLFGTTTLMMAANIPITIQGRGITELLAFYLWAGVIGTGDQVLLTCLAVYGVIVLQGSLGGLVLLMRRRPGAGSSPQSGESA